MPVSRPSPRTPLSLVPARTRASRGSPGKTGRVPLFTARVLPGRGRPRISRYASALPLPADRMPSGGPRGRPRFPDVPRKVSLTEPPLFGKVLGMLQTIFTEVAERYVCVFACGGPRRMVRGVGFEPTMHAHTHMADYESDVDSRSTTPASPRRSVSCRPISKSHMRFSMSLM